MKVGITYNLKEKANKEETVAGSPEERYEEFDSPETIEGIAKVLRSLGHEPVFIGFGNTAIRRLLENQVDFVFNIAEGYFGRSRESLIPAVLELLGIPYTGPDPLAAGITLDKAVAKRIATFAGVETPSYILVEAGKEVNFAAVEFPAIIKPAWEGSSKGIRLSSKVHDIKELEKELNRLREYYLWQTLLIEHFIDGREITVGMIGNSPPQVLGMMEIKPKKLKPEEFIYSLEVKRDYLKQVEYISPPEINNSIREKLERNAVTLFRAFGCRDVCRFDFRIDASGTPFFLEANALPGINPNMSDLVIMAKRMNIEYNELISRIFKSALSRYKKEEKYEHV